MGLRDFLMILFLLAVSSTAARAEVSREVIARAMGSVMSVYAVDGDERFLGSAIRFGRAGHGVTNAHVVGNARNVILELRNGTRHRVRVTRRDAGRDLALLDLKDVKAEPEPGLMPVAVLPAIGQPVVALGAPIGLGFTATSGIIAAAPRQVDAAVPLRLVQHDAAINPGSSGGALIDEAGQLVGLNSRIADGSRFFVGIGYAISGPDLARLVPLLARGELAALPDLGLDARPVGPRIATALNVARVGLLVDDVAPDGNAARAGLLPGDVLLSVNDRQIVNPGDLAFALESVGRGMVNIRLLRQGRALDLRLDMAAAPRVTPEGTSETTLETALGLGDLDIVLSESGRVIDLPADGLAARAGLLVGDRIMAVNGTPDGGDGFSRQVFTGPVLVRVRRDGVRQFHLTFDPASPDGPLRPTGAGNVLDMTVVRF